MPKPSILSQVTLLGCDKHISHFYFAGSLYIRLNNLTLEDYNKNKGAWVFRITKYGN